MFIQIITTKVYRLYNLETRQITEQGYKYSGKEDISDNTQIVVQEITDAQEDSQSVEEKSLDDQQN